MRVLADRDLKDILSKPTKLIGEFKKEDEFENLIRVVNKENASSVKKQG
jgi:mannose-6-phosphate isomerase class I